MKYHTIGERKAAKRARERERRKRKRITDLEWREAQKERGRKWRKKNADKASEYEKARNLDQARIEYKKEHKRENIDTYRLNEKIKAERNKYPKTPVFFCAGCGKCFVRTGNQRWCKQCSKEYYLIYGREYEAKRYEENKEELLRKDKERRLKDPTHRERMRAYANSRKEITAQRNRARMDADPEYRKRVYKNNYKYKMRRVKKDHGYAMLHRLRNRLSRYPTGHRSKTMRQLVGLTTTELKAWIENQFRPGMTWNNRSEWHIDHIMPCASFDMADPEQVARCFHYTNLQPLWAKDNLSKGASMPESVGPLGLMVWGNQKTG